MDLDELIKKLQEFRKILKNDVYVEILDAGYEGASIKDIQWCDKNNKLFIIQKNEYWSENY